MAPNSTSNIPNTNKNSNNNDEKRSNADVNPATYNMHEYKKPISEPKTSGLYAGLNRKQRQATQKAERRAQKESARLQVTNLEKSPAVANHSNATLPSSTSALTASLIEASSIAPPPRSNRLSGNASDFEPGEGTPTIEPAPSLEAVTERAPAATCDTEPANMSGEPQAGTPEQAAKAAGQHHADMHSRVDGKAPSPTPFQRRDYSAASNPALPAAQLSAAPSLMTEAEDITSMLADRPEKKAFWDFITSLLTRPAQHWQRGANINSQRFPLLFRGHQGLNENIIPEIEELMVAMVENSMAMCDSLQDSQINRAHNKAAALLLDVEELSGRLQEDKKALCNEANRLQDLCPKSQKLAAMQSLQDFVDRKKKELQDLTHQEKQEIARRAEDETRRINQAIMDERKKAAKEFPGVDWREEIERRSKQMKKELDDQFKSQFKAARDQMEQQLRQENAVLADRLQKSLNSFAKQISNLATSTNAEILRMGKHVWKKCCDLFDADEESEEPEEPEEPAVEHTSTHNSLSTISHWQQQGHLPPGGGQMLAPGGYSLQSSHLGNLPAVPGQYGPGGLGQGLY